MGVPTVAIVSTPFVKAAKNIAEGIEGMVVRDVVVKHPITQTGDTAKEKANDIIDGLIAALSRQPPGDSRETRVEEQDKTSRIIIRCKWADCSRNRHEFGD